VDSTLRVVRNPALLTLMFGHFSNDLFAGVLPMLFPVMKDRFDLSNATVGLATLAYTGASSLSQPFFGFLFDRGIRRWYPSAILLWASVFVASYGFAGSFALFVFLAAMAGVASGAYHPLGASNAAVITEDRHQNTALSFYTVGGTSGFALGPLVAVGLLAAFGTRGTGWLIVPGAAAAALLLVQMPRVMAAKARRVAIARGRPAAAVVRPQWGALARVIGVVMLRSWVFLSVLQFVPVWYDELGYGRGMYGALQTTIVLAGAVGTLLGGALADRVGQRRVILVSMILAIPALLLFAGLPGPIAFLTGALFGIICDSSLSVTLVVAQRLLPGRVGMASGVILGLGFITGGIGVPITGAIADALGIQTALMLLGVLLVAGAALGLTVPAAKMERSSAEEVTTEAAETVSAARTPSAGPHPTPSGGG